MRIARYRVAGEPGISFGVVDDSGDEVAVVGIDGHPFAPFQAAGPRHRLDDVTLLAPVLPSKVVCIGRNYADHAREMGGEAPSAPVLFLKPSTSVVGDGDRVVLPADSDRVDYEGELAVVVKRLCKDVPRQRVPEVVLGYTCANDVTARDHQQSDGQWARGKGHDTFCPLGPWVVTDLDPSDLALQTELDGKLVQDARTSMLVHDVASLVAFVSRAMTLLPGDVILTGTPAGVGPLRAGQEVTVTVEGVGTLSNPVVAEGRRA